MTEPQRPLPDPTQTRSIRWHLHAWERWYRDLWSLVLTGFVVLALIAQAHSNAAQTHANAIFRSQVRQGRQYAIGVSCAVESAVAQAGRATILRSGTRTFSKRYLRHLEALGYRPLSHAALRRAADAYAQSIDAAVRRQVGVSGLNLVEPSGTIDCARLKHRVGAAG